MKHLFFGGIHPKYNKEMSTTSLDFITMKPKTVVIPLVQHIGVPCKALVAVGDRVLSGLSTQVYRIFTEHYRK